MIRGLIFDFDGLILDTEYPDFLTWSEIYDSRGHKLPLDEWQRRVGMGADLLDFDPYARLEVLVGEKIARAEIRLARRARLAALIAEEEVRPGVREYLDAARSQGLGLAIASSSPRQWIEGHLERLGLDRAFDCVRCAEDVARTKPDPELYLSALAELGLGSTEAIAFEDSLNGLRAAKAAEIRCVVVPNQLTRGLDFVDADLILDSLACLPLDRLIELSTSPLEVGGVASRRARRS